MRRYKEIFNNDPEYPLPRVFGLTATILKKTVRNQDRIPSAIKAVEELLCCTAMTYREDQREEVQS
jgi:hypothetical protein